MLNLTLYVSPIVSSNINDTNINDTNINDQSSSIIKCSSLRLIRYSSSSISYSISYSINKEKKYYIVGIPFPPVLIHSLAKYLNIHTNGGFIEQKRKEKKKTIQDVILEKFLDIHQLIYRIRIKIRINIRIKIRIHHHRYKIY